MPSEGDTLRPCPLSGFRIQAKQAWQMMLTFSIYQLVLGSLLFFLAWFSRGPSLLGQTYPGYFIAASGSYTVAVVCSLPLMWIRRPAYRWQAALHILLDLAVLPVFIYTSGGLESGLGILLAVTITSAGLLIGGRCAVGLAALATLILLCIEFYADLYDVFPGTHYTYAGLLGMSYFAITFLAIALASMAEQSEALALKREADLTYQRQLNEFIIQNLQSGIVVLDADNHLLLSNDATRRLLDLPAKPGSTSELPHQLTQHLHDWPADVQELGVTVATPNAPLYVRFNRIIIQDTRLTMIYLEDDSLHQKRVQEGKLASLGRLTAGIAHEIRNPLAAISHAAQLLAESKHLDDQDQRLVSIVCKQVRRMDDTIGNVLQLSRRNAARREKICLNVWLDSFSKDFQVESQTTSNPIDIELSVESLNVWADPSQLKQILSNLCHNALKYGPGEDGRVLLRLRRDDEDRPTIEVIDHGKGIPASQVQQIFEPFFTTSPSGTGLGLYISRELAQLNQAQLQYDNGPQGSCFSLTLVDADQVTVAI